jgi:DNA-binding XRE family transcriptional regulator
MKSDKRKRLQAAGWTVGSAAVFLGLSPEEAAIVEVRASLARTLREARERHEWTQAELASRIGSSQSRVAKMEAADRSVSIDLLVRSLLIAGTPGTVIGRAFAGAGARRRPRKTA